MSPLCRVSAARSGTRQGCSWGSFLYSLTILPLLRQLADEPPDCKALAFLCRRCSHPRPALVGDNGTHHHKLSISREKRIRVLPERVEKGTLIYGIIIMEAADEEEEEEE